MDRYELTIKIEQLEKLVKNKDYGSAAKVADHIEWKKIKQWAVMSNAIEAFTATGKYDKARNVCIYAYNRKLGGRRLLATLIDMYVRLGEFEDAEEIYQEYVETAPRDLARYTLLYKLKRAQGAPVGELIDILQEYKENELDEAYEYELAVLYSEAGLTDKCVSECDELVLWFADGIYVEKALRLKQKYAPLTTRQSEQLARLVRVPAVGTGSQEPAPEPADNEDEEWRSKPEADDERTESEYAQTWKEPETHKEPKVCKEPEPRKESELTDIQPETEKQKTELEKQKLKLEKQKPKPEPRTELKLEPKPEPEQLAEKPPKYIDNIGNTTEWSPIDVENMLQSDTDYAEAVETVESAPVKADMELIEDDYEINIKVPDYSVYDTRNVQQELKANVEEIMEAYHNREKKEELLEAQEPELPDENAEPTKEIIINKHQWRKASRNTEEKARRTKVQNTVPRPQTTDKTAGKTVMDSLTIEQMAAIVARLQAEQQAREKEAKEADQIEGQMDITQWLSELGEEQPGNAAVREAAAAVENSSDTEEPEDEIFEEIPDTEASEEESYKEISDTKELEEVFRGISDTKKPEEVFRRISDTKEPEEIFEEIPDIEEPKEETFEEISDIEEPEAGHEEEELPDLETAINAGIEKIIDDTVKSAVNDSNIAGEAGNYMLRPEERRFMERYLYMAGMERRLCRYIGGLRNAPFDGTSSTGNAVIMGNRSTDKTAFAVNLFKALHAYDVKREHKLARISADRINANGFESIRDRIYGQTLVIENAGVLRREQISSMLEFMDSSTGGALFILEDEEFNINKLFAENPDFAGKFTGRFLLKQYTVNELVDIAKDYADEQGWSIEDKALLKLYLILSKLPNDDQGDIVNVVNDIIKYAGEHAKNRLGNKLFGRFRSVLVIKESDFEASDDDDDYEDEEDEEYDDGRNKSGKKDHSKYDDDDDDDEDDDDYDDDEDDE